MDVVTLFLIGAFGSEGSGSVRDGWSLMEEKQPGGEVLGLLVVLDLPWFWLVMSHSRKAQESALTLVPDCSVMPGEC